MAENKPDVRPCPGPHADGTTVDKGSQPTPSPTMQDGIISFEEFVRTIYPGIKALCTSWMGFKDNTKGKKREYEEYLKRVEEERRWKEKLERDRAEMERRRYYEEQDRKRAEELHEKKMEELRRQAVTEDEEHRKLVEAERREKEHREQQRNQMDNIRCQQQEEAEKMRREAESKRFKEKKEVEQKRQQERVEEEARRKHELETRKQGFQQQTQKLQEEVNQQLEKRKVELEKEKKKLREQREQKRLQRLAEEEKEKKNREEREIRQVETFRKMEQESQEKFRRQREEENAKILEKEMQLDNNEREEKRNKQVEELEKATENKHLIEQERLREEEEAKRKKENYERKQRRQAELKENRKKLDEELALEKIKVLNMQKEAIEQMKRMNEEALIAAQRRGQASAAQLGNMMRQIYDKGIEDGMMIIKKKFEEAKFRENGALILHDGGALSVDIADQLANMLINQGFIVPQPLLDTGEQPPCPARCHLTWLVMYVVLFEDQSAKRLHEVVQTASQYLSNSVFHECSKLFIVQCQSQPKKDVRRLLRSMGNTTAIVAGLPGYHQDIFEKLLSKTTSFDDVPDKLIDHAKTQSQCISNS